MSDYKEEGSTNIEKIVLELADLEDLKEELREVLVAELRGAKTLNKRLNVLLVSRLVDAMTIRGEIMEGITMVPGWEKEEDFVKEAKTFIKDEFGFLNDALQSVFAIGQKTSKDASSENISLYIQESYFLVSYAWKLIVYGLFSAYWELDADKRDVAITDKLKAFFKPMTLNKLHDHIEMVEAFSQLAVELPLLKSLKSLSYTKLKKHAQKLDDLYSQRDQSTILEAFEMELKVSHLLKPLMFLQDYDVLSIKDVLYQKQRKLAAAYLVQLSSVKSDHSREDIKKEQPIINNSVLLVNKQSDFGEEGSESFINLSPFFMDLGKEGNCALAYYSKNMIIKLNYMHTKVELRDRDIEVYLNKEVEEVILSNIKEQFNQFKKEILV